MPSNDFTELTSAVEKLTRAMEQGGGGRAGTAAAATTSKAKVSSITDQARDRISQVANGRALGGGLRGLGAQAAFGAAGLAGSAGIAVAGAALSGGLLGQHTGAGFGAGATRGLNSLASKIPVLGEIGGFAQTERTLRGAGGDLNQITNQVARFGGTQAISPKVREFLADTFVAQNKNVQENERINKGLITKRIGDAAQEGTASARMVELLGDIVEFISKIAGAF